MRPLETDDGTTALRLVTGLFLRRLLDHDAISPHADRHESLAVLYALLVTYGFASVERFALESTTRAAVFGAALSLIVLMVRIIDRVQRRERVPLNFDERPAPATQRLGLFEHLAIHD
jgi:hypothetical protein